MRIVVTAFAFLSQQVWSFKIRRGDQFIDCHDPLACCLWHSYETEEQLLQKFQQYKSKYNKVYKTTDEEAKRFGNWKISDQQIKRNLCDKKKTYTKAFTKLSDLSPEEFNRLASGFRPGYEFNKAADLYPKFEVLSPEQIPQSVDWVKAGKVTPVKDQGEKCQGCFAFSAAGAVESALAIEGMPLIDRSIQQLIDCMDRAKSGCETGDARNALEYIKENPFMKHQDYPFYEDLYKNVEGETFPINDCKLQETLGEYTLSIHQPYAGVVDSIAGMKSAISKRPVVAAIAAPAEVLQNYSTGIILNPEECEQEVRHSILIVGYGQEVINDKLVDFYLCKNSWSSDWGDQGYFKVGQAEGRGICGINVYVTIPITTKFVSAPEPIPTLRPVIAEPVPIPTFCPVIAQPVPIPTQRPVIAQPIPIPTRCPIKERCCDETCSDCCDLFEHKAHRYHESMFQEVSRFDEIYNRFDVFEQNIGNIGGYNRRGWFGSITE